jgi:hypothetical protein
MSNDCATRIFHRFYKGFDRQRAIVTGEKPPG